MTRNLIHLGAPLLTALLLVGMTTVDKLRMSPHVADAFHARAAAAVAEAPQVIGDWRAGKDIPLEKDAEGMLQPNGFLHRVFSNARSDRSVELMLVQCRDSRFMQGHYPPVCYKSNGCDITLPGDALDWQVGDLTIHGREYRVTQVNGYQQMIRNFFVLPSGKLARDMESVIAAAKDQQELVYGVAQFQVLFDASVGGAERDAIFNTLIEAHRPLIDVLRQGDMRSAGR
jgi:Protein of unknown function (DUF3485)